MAAIIIQEVEKTFDSYDPLKSQITQPRQHSEMLMQAVLREAFES